MKGLFSPTSTTVVFEILRYLVLPGLLGVRLRLRMSFLVLTHSTA